MESIETTVITYIPPSEKEEKEKERLEDMGIEVFMPETKEYKKKYFFVFDRILEVGETMVTYNGVQHEAVVCTFILDGIVSNTPAMLINYDEFIKSIKQMNIWSKN